MRSHATPRDESQLPSTEQQAITHVCTRSGNNEAPPQPSYPTLSPSSATATATATRRRLRRLPTPAPAKHHDQQRQRRCARRSRARLCQNAMLAGTSTKHIRYEPLRRKSALGERIKQHPLPCALSFRILCSPLKVGDTHFE